jgi:transposase
MWRMQVKVLGVERRRRWGLGEKARIVEETMAPGAVVCEVARRHGVSQSLVFSWRRQARAEGLAEARGSTLLPVEIAASTMRPVSAFVGDPRSLSSKRRAKSGVIEIKLGSGERLCVDNDVDADALRRVLDVLSRR